MKKSKTFIVEYNYFEPGTKVTASTNGHRCPVQFGKVYVVKECSEPMFPGEDAIVLLEGEKYGISTVYLVEAGE